MEDFFKADGLSRIIFYFQEVDNIPDAGTVFANRFSRCVHVCMVKMNNMHLNNHAKEINWKN